MFVRNIHILYAPSTSRVSPVTKSATWPPPPMWSSALNTVIYTVINPMITTYLWHPIIHYHSPPCCFTSLLSSHYAPASMSLEDEFSPNLSLSPCLLTNEGQGLAILNSLTSVSLTNSTNDGFTHTHSCTVITTLETRQQLEEGCRGTSPCGLDTKKKQRPSPVLKNLPWRCLLL